MKGKLFLFAITLCFVLVSHGNAEVVEGPRGPVEFIGLENWTATELYKAIQEQDPDKPFHACAAVLKSDLEFADAAAFGFMKSLEDGTMNMYTVVVGIEDESGVQYRTPGNKTLDLPESWQELQTVVNEDFNTLAALVQARYQSIELNQPDKAPELATYFGANSETVDAVWKLIDSSYEKSDHQLALDVLEKDSSWTARAVATMILGYFHENDESWHGLADSLIDSDARVRNLAGRVLDGLVHTNKTIQVQWSDASETLTALFGGTNPFAFNQILTSLVATEIENEFAEVLVQKDPDLLLAYAGSEHEKFRTPALDFLKAVSGEDFGSNVESWKAWLKKQKSDT